MEKFGFPLLNLRCRAYGIGGWITMKRDTGHCAHAGVCAAMLAIAVLLRLATAAETQELLRDAAASPSVMQTLLRLEMGGGTADAPSEPSAAEEDKPSDSETEETAEVSLADHTVEEETAAAPAPELTFTQADVDGIVMAGLSSYEPDVAELLLQHPLELDFSRGSPQVLIIHTHASEAYTPEPGWEYEPSDTLRTEDTNYNVVRVGQEMADTLEAAGIGVIHDTTIRDYPTYNGSYTRTLAAIEEYLATYPSIQIVIDVHRDAAENADGSAVAVSCTADGQDAAQLMLVVGTDEGGLPHPDWEENLSLALRVQALLNRSYPDLCRSIDLRTERFNQHATLGSLLVEVGASGNTLAEALVSARLFADALAQIILAESS